MPTFGLAVSKLDDRKDCGTASFWMIDGPLEDTEVHLCQLTRGWTPSPQTGAAKFVQLVRRATARDLESSSSAVWLVAHSCSHSGGRHEG